jgi:molybdopterin molybdotransferase
MGKEFLKVMDPAEVKKIISTLNFKKNRKCAHRKGLSTNMAKNVQATINLPPFKRAAMDGYAVKAKDTFEASEDNPNSLKLSEVIMAGATPQHIIINPFSCFLDIL